MGEKPRACATSPAAQMLAMLVRMCSSTSTPARSRRRCLREIGHRRNAGGDEQQVRLELGAVGERRVAAIACAATDATRAPVRRRTPLAAKTFSIMPDAWASK
jgi:hypothetical protein